MDLDGIKDEMARKPDAQSLVEWIDGTLADFHCYPDDVAPYEAIREAIGAYFQAIES